MTSVKTANTTTKLCNFSKLIEYMKSDRLPDIPEYEKCSVIECIENGNQVTKIVRKKLPIPKAAVLVLGHSYANFRYDIIYDDKAIVCVTSNPPVIAKYFNYNESITIINLEDGRIEITRETETINLSERMLVASFFTRSVEENYHEQCLLYLNSIIEECQD